MRKMPMALVAVLAVLFALSSCLGTEEVELSDKTAITGFSLSGTVKALYHTTSSTGEDSTYIGNIDCTRYKFYIDQEKSLIYNEDSIPYNCDLTRVLLSVNYTGGYLACKSFTSDSIGWYNSTDSIDMTQTREFQVYSSSGKYVRKYQVTINKHTEDVDTFMWKEMPECEAFRSLKAMRSVTLGKRVFVFGATDTETKVYATVHGDQWDELVGNRTLGPDAYQGVVLLGDKMYVYDSGEVLCSEDGAIWEVLSSPALHRLVAASSRTLYAYDPTDTKILASTDGGQTWHEDALDDSPSLLPVSYLSYITTPLTTNAKTDQVVLFGSQSETDYPNDKHAVVWGKLDEHMDYGESQPWMRYVSSSYNRYEILRLRDMQALLYDNRILMTGREGICGSDAKAFGMIYASADHGITWKRDTVVNIPKDFPTTTEVYALTGSDAMGIWLVSADSGRVWRGMIKRLAWRKEQEQQVFTY